MKDVGACVIAFLVIGLGGLIVRMLLAGVGAGASAAVRTATGKGSFSGNFNASMWGMSAPECRLRETRLGDRADGPRMQEVQLRGLFPISRPVRLGAVTHVYDAETKLPVICALEQFQEPDSIVFQHRAELGPVRPNQGLTDWVRVGAVFPEIIKGPVGGRRLMHVVVRFIDLDNPPPIRIGTCQPGHPGLLWASNVLAFEFEFSGKGFQELSVEQEEALAAAVRVAVSMAMADGSMHEAEGLAIKEWMQKALSGFGETRRQTLKERLNGSFKDAFAEAARGELDLEDALLDLDGVEDPSIKYQVLQLAFDVLAADGSVDSAEIRVIEQIAETLDLDIKEVERIRDQKLVGLASQTMATANLDEVLGIRSDWDRETIHRHLRSEFQKWNGRLNTLPEGAERQSAQRMIDMIAEARKKHG